MKTNIAELLTAKQKLFCDEYLIDMNATRAALRAGYSGYTALNGSLMSKPKVKLYLQQRTELAAQKAQVTPDMILTELCKIAFGNLGNYFGDDGKLKAMSDLTDDEKAALLSASIDDTGVMQIKMYNKLTALDRIAKHLNFYRPEIKQPETRYVYLDKEDLTEDDRLEDEEDFEEGQRAEDGILMAEGSCKHEAGSTKQERFIEECGKYEAGSMERNKVKMDGSAEPVVFFDGASPQPSPKERELDLRGGIANYSVNKGEIALEPIGVLVKERMAQSQLALPPIGAGLREMRDARYRMR